ncbi:MAG: HU family DNA-binding protein [Acidimicrobiia bacterium]|nr:HU family DNA-binding protein [Acidimicrobiia bacterium]
MTKQDLIAKLAEDVGLTKVTAWAALESVLDGITKSLRKGDPVTLVGFGTFKTSVRPGRTGRNPRTGKAVTIPRRTVARFTPGATLKKALKG